MQQLRGRYSLRWICSKCCPLATFPSLILSMLAPFRTGADRVGRHRDRTDAPCDSLMSLLTWLASPHLAGSFNMEDIVRADKEANVHSFIM